MSRASTEDFQALLNSPAAIDSLMRNMRRILAAIDKYRQDLLAGETDAQFHMPISDEGFERHIQLYEALCVAINERLTNCAMLISSGNPPEAIRLAEVSPRLLDLFTIADLSDQERQDWAEFLVENERPIPTFILRDNAETLAEACGGQSPELQHYSAELRILVLARAPFSVRIATLRKLARLDARFASDLKDWEKVRLEQIDREADDAYRLRQSDCQTAFTSIVTLLNELSAEGWSEWQTQKRELERKIDRRLQAVQQMLQAANQTSSRPANKKPAERIDTPAEAAPVWRIVPEEVPRTTRRSPPVPVSVPAPVIEEASPVEIVLTSSEDEIVVPSAGSEPVTRSRDEASPVAGVAPGPLPPPVPRQFVATNRTKLIVIAAAGLLAAAAGFIAVEFLYLAPQRKEILHRTTAQEEWKQHLANHKKNVLQLQTSLDDFKKVPLDPSAPVPPCDGIVEGHRAMKDTERRALEIVKEKAWEKYLPNWEHDIQELSDNLNEPLKRLEERLNGFLMSVDNSLKTEETNIKNGSLEQPISTLKIKHKQLQDLQHLTSLLPAARDRSIQLFKWHDELVSSIENARLKNRRIVDLEKLTTSIRTTNALNAYVQKLQDYVSAYPDDAHGLDFDQVVRLERILWQQAIEVDKYVAVGWLDQDEPQWKCRTRWHPEEQVELFVVASRTPGGREWQKIGTIENGRVALNNSSNTGFKRGRLVFRKYSAILDK